MRVRAGALALAIVLTAAGQAGAEPEVVARSTLSGDAGLPAACSATRSESFPVLGVDPGAPDRISAVFLNDGHRGAAAARSSDGGATWAREPVPGATSCTGGPPERDWMVNPQLVAGPGGSAYFGNSWISGDSQPIFRFGVAVHGRDSAGWTPGVAPGADLTGAQNVSMVADPGEPGTVFAAWVHFDAVPVPPQIAYAPVASDALAATSTDGGRTFSEPVRIHPPSPDRYVINVRAARLPTGALLVVYDTAFKPDLAGALLGAPVVFTAYAVRSTDGGRSWSAPSQVGMPGQFAIADPEPQRAPAGAVPARIAGQAKFDLAVAPDGRAYVTWSETRGDGGVVRVVESADGGATWSAPIDVASRPAAPFETEIAVAGDGTVGVFFYDMADDVPGDDALTTTPRLVISGDDGWSVVDLDAPFDLRSAYQPGVPYDGDQALGVTQGLAGLPVGFGAAYTVAAPLATDGKTDVRFARVSP